MSLPSLKSATAHDGPIVRVRLHREVVAGLDAPRARFERALRVACGLRDLFLRHREPAPVVEHARLVGERGTGPPVHSHRPRRLDSGPFAARDHGEEVFLAHGLDVAVHLARLGEVDLLDARLVEVGADDARMQHPGHAHVVDVGELAGNLAGNVDPPDRFPDQAVVGALLERDLRIDLDVEPVADQLAVAQRLRRIGLHPHHAVVHDQLVHRYRKPLRRALHQRPAGARRGAPQLRAALENRQICRGEPLVGRGRGVAHHHLDPLEGDVELLGRELRQRGAGPGAEVDLAAVHGDAVFRADGQPGVDRLFRDRLRRAQRLGAGRAEHGKADDERAARLEEFTPIDVRHGDPFKPPPRA